MSSAVLECVAKANPPPVLPWHALRDPWLVQPALVEGSPLVATGVTVSGLVAKAREREAAQPAANGAKDQLASLRLMGSPTFTYERDERDEESTVVDEAQEHDTLTMPPGRAFERVLAPPDNASYAYMSVRLFNLGPSEGLWRAWGLLDVADRLVARVESDLQTKVDNAMAWIGQAGVRATSHIDHEHNLFVQADGSKRFTLFPPAAHRRMRLYPVWHARARQAQSDLDADADDADDGGGGGGGGGWVVTLRPGDVLHIPGGVFHRAESITPNVAFNVWYDSPLKTRLPARARLLEGVAAFARPSSAAGGGGLGEAKAAAELAWATEGEAAVWLARHLHRVRLWLVLLEGLVAVAEEDDEKQQQQLQQDEGRSSVEAALASGGDSKLLAPLLASVVARGTAAVRARAAALLESRYGPLVVDGREYRRARKERAPLLSALAHGCHANDAQAMPLGWRRRLAQTRALLSELHAAFAAPLMTMDAARRQLWLDDATEHVAVWALGSVVPSADATLLVPPLSSPTPHASPSSSSLPPPSVAGGGLQRLEALGEEGLLGAAGAETFLRECLVAGMRQAEQQVGLAGHGAYFFSDRTLLDA